MEMRGDRIEEKVRESKIGSRGCWDIFSFLGSGVSRGQRKRKVK